MCVYVTCYMLYVTNVKLRFVLNDDTNRYTQRCLGYNDIPSPSTGRANLMINNLITFTCVYVCKYASSYLGH